MSAAAAQTITAEAETELPAEAGAVAGEGRHSALTGAPSEPATGVVVTLRGDDQAASPRPVAAPEDVPCAYWTTWQVSRWRGCSVKAVKTLRERHGLPFEEIGGRGGYRYSIAAVKAWAESRQVVLEPEPRKLRADARGELSAHPGPHTARRRTTRAIGPRPVAIGI